jgi:hypothetical protein
MDSATPGAGLVAQGLPMRDAPFTQAWPGKQADFDLCLVEPASVSGRVRNREPIPEPVTQLLAAKVGERFSPVNVEVVEYQVDGRRFRVMVRPPADYLGERGARTVRGGKSKRLARFRLDRAKDIRCAAPSLFVVIACFAARRSRRRGPHLGGQSDGLFIQTKDWFSSMIRLFIGGQNILSWADVILIQFRHAPHFPPPRLEVVGQEQKADDFSPHFRGQWAFDGFLRDQPDGPAGTPGGGIAADHGNDALPLTFPQQRSRSGPRLIVEGPVQSGFLLATSDLPDGLRSQLHLGRDFGNSFPLMKLAKGQPSKDHAYRLPAAAQDGIQKLTVAFPPSHAKTPVCSHV